MGNVPNSALQLQPPTNFKTQWNMKLVYKLIETHRLDDENATVDAEECPICLNYLVGGLNRGKCCSKGVCTPCYLTIKKTPETPFGCPFCLVPSFEVHYLGPKTSEQIAMELEDIRKVNELKQKIRQEEIESDRQRELKRQKEREEAAARSQARNVPVPVTPPKSPDSLYGSPTLPSHFIDLHKSAVTQQEKDEAELAAAIWLSLNPDAVEQRQS